MKSTAILLLVFCDAAAIRLTGAEEKPGDAGRGRVIFNQCLACHAPNPTDVPNPGPDLRGVIGRPAGSVPGYRYSRALRNVRRSWTEMALDAFLADPQAAVPGNTMPFPGMTDDTERRDLIAYLKTLQ
jgi:cytochrome c